MIYRKAKKEDMPAVYDLVIELAVYEKEPEAVTSTIEDYYSSFEEGLIDVVVAELEDGKIVGMALYYMAFSTWKGKMMYLEDFYIQPEYRQDGIGQKLFEMFLEESKKRGAVLTKWQVLDWNTPAINFYDKNNAIIEKNWWNGKLFLK